jgi:CRISPR-associated protein Cmr4
MPTDAALIFLLAESPLHAGTGSTLSYMDLPIQREEHTGHPVVYSSSVKGGLRELCETMKGNGSPEVKELFGPEGDDTNMHGGMGIFKEGRVALFPVRSFKGTFAWVTCPSVLARLKRDIESVFEVSKGLISGLIVPPEPSPDKAYFSSTSSLKVDQQGVNAPGAVVLEEYVFERAAEPAASPGRQPYADTWGGWFAEHALPAAAADGGNGADPYQWWRQKMNHDVVVLSDDDFTYFVRYHTEIQTHVKIDSATGTAAKSGPWQEESLPTDTLLYTLLIVPRMVGVTGKTGTFSSPLAAVDFFRAVCSTAPAIQLCGDRSLGKGFVRATIAPRPGVTSKKSEAGGSH